MASKLPPKTLSLKQFMVQRQVLQLYRQILKTIRQVPDKSSQKDLLVWARDDFKANKHHTDEHTIKALLFHGQRSLKELQQSLDLSTS